MLCGELEHGLRGTGNQYCMTKHGSSYPQIVYWLRVSGVWNYPIGWAYIKWGRDKRPGLKDLALSWWIGARFFDAGEICELRLHTVNRLASLYVGKQHRTNNETGKPYKMAMDWAQFRASHKLPKSCSKRNQKLLFVSKVAQKLLDKTKTFFGLMLKICKLYNKSKHFKQQTF